MAIEVNNKTKSRVDITLIKRIAKVFLKSYKIEKREISIALVSDWTISKLNNIYRGSNKITDVLAFSGEGSLLGEIIIDYSQVKRQARRYGNTEKEELVFVLAHGLLHLIGYDDRTEKQRKEMEELGEKFIVDSKFRIDLKRVV